MHGRSCYREEFFGAFTAIGLGAGLALDALHVGTTAIYRAPRRRVSVLPLVGRGRGSVLSIITIGR